MALQVINELKRKGVRLVGAAQGVVPGRKGKCTPYECATVDGRKGAACCKLGYVCLLLKKNGRHACELYSLRPVNCRVFPRSKKDLELVKRCGYYWD